MKKKIVVFGLGRDFKRYRKDIMEKFDVIACTDNAVVPEDEFWKDCYILPKDIGKCNFDKVLVCSRKYQDAIRVQLVRLGISAGRILCLESLDQDVEPAAFEEVIQDMDLYQSLNTDIRFSVAEDSLFLIDKDKYACAGTPSQHYFAQDIWGANKVFHNKPDSHYDIGSSLNGFIAHLLAFREVNYIDIRPLPYEIPGLHFVQGDATNLCGFEDGTMESISCFHAMEHFGLGRYGDRVDPDAYKRAAESIQRVLRKEGHLYLGVPVGPSDRLVFNAHRIFSISTILSLFDKMKLQDIAIVEPDGVCAKHIEARNFQEIRDYSCGLFEFIKED